MAADQDRLATTRNPYQRRRIEIEVTAHDDDFNNLCDALLHVADLVDPGQVDVSAGPAHETVSVPVRFLVAVRDGTDAWTLSGGFPDEYHNALSDLITCIPASDDNGSRDECIGCIDGPCNPECLPHSRGADSGRDEVLDPDPQVVSQEWLDQLAQSRAGAETFDLEWDAPSGSEHATP